MRWALGRGTGKVGWSDTVWGFIAFGYYINDREPLKYFKSWGRGIA